MAKKKAEMEEVSSTDMNAVTGGNTVPDTTSGTTGGATGSDVGAEVITPVKKELQTGPAPFTGKPPGRR